MCNNCNCDNYDLCSIVGHMPVGFCCSKCILYDEEHTCLKMKTKRASSIGVKKIESEGEIHPLSTSIENGMLKVVIEQKDKKIPIFIDLKRQLGPD
ncbi:MAG: hypothetical protein JW891_05625 [Candidatus Lokiarchaeota archaeon]|nr:hypothetical protein [Candidatus Lokiarchaeota archaeon]